MALADTVRSFRQDADLEVCLGKCTIYMPGIPEERAHQLIRDCIVTNASGILGPLFPMLAPNLDVIQVTRPSCRGHPRGHIRIRPPVRAKQVRHYLQGRRKPCAFVQTPS
jgi:hypothetical protein